jgi:hypothetical protein
MVPVRRAAVAGSWYPAQPEALAREVDRYLSAAGDLPAGRPLAIIAPHAGLMYSGPIAAHAYKLLYGHDIEIAVLVGPSHYVGFEGAAIYERGAFETPFGHAIIAEDCAAALVKASPLVAPHPTAHGREHSLEMQLPFLKRVLPDAQIVPIVMGYQRRETAYAVGDAIAAAVSGRKAVLVASTDLSHYHNAPTAGRLDRKVIRHVERFDADGLMSLLETCPEHACGGGPTVSVMRAARALGAPDARVLKYGDSSDVSGDKDAVVGYLAAYAAMNLGAFGVVAIVSRRLGAVTLDDYRGLAVRSPWLAVSLAFFLASLAGLPPGLIGLLVKVRVLIVPVDSGMWWLAAVMAVATVIGLAYYLTWAARLFRRPKGQSEALGSRTATSRRFR